MKAAPILASILFALSGCAFPPSKELTERDKGISAVNGTVLSIVSRIQEPLPIDMSATTVPVTSDSTAGTELIRGIVGALDGSSRHRSYIELRYKTEAGEENIIELPAAAKSKYQAGDRIRVLSKDHQKTVVNQTLRARLGLVAPHGL